MAQLTRYNIVIGLIVALGAYGYGFGYGMFITVIGLPGFYKDLDLDRECALSPVTMVDSQSTQRRANTQQSESLAFLHSPYTGLSRSQHHWRCQRPLLRRMRLRLTFPGLGGRLARTQEISRNCRPICSGRGRMDSRLAICGDARHSQDRAWFRAGHVAMPGASISYRSIATPLSWYNVGYDLHGIWSGICTVWTTKPLPTFY